MSFYRDSDGNVYGFLPNDIDVTEMTDAEVDAHINPKPTPEQLAERAKSDAHSYLANTDWYVIRQSETGVVIPEEVSENRARARELL